MHLLVRDCTNCYAKNPTPLLRRLAPINCLCVGMCRDYLLVSADAVPLLVDRGTRRISRRRAVPEETPTDNVTAAMAALGMPTVPVPP